jgi:GT2 family glycosyltransferase
MNPTLDIIIVNWNSGDYLFECISSIKNAYHPSYSLCNIVIIDNASQDGSLHKIENLDLPIKLIKNSLNLGFSKACNEGAKNSKADYLLFLNPDTRLYNDSLYKPILFLQDFSNRNIGIAGVKSIDEQNNVNRNCASFPSPVKFIYMSLGLDKLFPKIFPDHFITQWDHLDNRIVDQVMGSFYLIRKSLFEKLNGYDENFFVYYEDLDLAYRANKLGYKSYYLANATIYHKGGGTTEKVKAIRLYYILYSKLVYCKKHYNTLTYYLIFIFTIFIEPFPRIIDAMLKGSKGDIWGIIVGYKKLLHRIFL